MRARVIKSFTDRYSLETIEIDREIEISEARFSELTTGPRGVFVEEIKEPVKEQVKEPVTEQTKKPTRKSTGNTAKK